LSEQKKWADKLGSECGLSSAFLKSALEELSESCHGDSRTAREVLEELTVSCHMDEQELKKFLSEVAKSCPLDEKKLREEVVKAKGKKELAFKATGKATTKDSSERFGAR
jgi:hypothetical protein